MCDLKFNIESKIFKEKAYLQTEGFLQLHATSSAAKTKQKTKQNKNKIKTLLKPMRYIKKINWKQFLVKTIIQVSGKEKKQFKNFHKFSLRFKKALLFGADLYYTYVELKHVFAQVVLVKPFFRFFSPEEFVFFR